MYYRAATDLIGLVQRGEAHINLAEALTVLLGSWNQAYYRAHPPTSQHVEALQRLIDKHSVRFASARERTLETFSDDDETSVKLVFHDFEVLLGAVGAAKGLHLLAPRFFPIWDRYISTVYVGIPKPTGFNAERYIAFMAIVRAQTLSISRHGDPPSDLLKLLDEYNYCRFTKGWIE